MLGARRAAVRALQVAGNAAVRPLRPAKMCNLFLRGSLVRAQDANPRPRSEDGAFDEWALPKTQQDLAATPTSEIDTIDVA
jgi:hypothetical protein